MLFKDGQLQCALSEMVLNTLQISQSLMKEGKVWEIQQPGPEWPEQKKDCGQLDLSASLFLRSVWFSGISWTTASSLHLVWISWLAARQDCAPSFMASESQIYSSSESWCQIPIHSALQLPVSPRVSPPASSTTVIWWELTKLTFWGHFFYSLPSSVLPSHFTCLYRVVLSSVSFHLQYT